MTLISSQTALSNAFRHPQTGARRTRGLTGIRERAKLIGGTLDVWSELETGTPSPPLPVIRQQNESIVMSTAPGPIRILVVDDHPILREGIAGLVAGQPDLTLAAEASNGREAIERFRLHRPDVTLMDLQMPEMNGVDAMIAIRGEFPDARIVVLTTYTCDVQVVRALKAGARGYLLKNLLYKDLLDTIRAVHAGKKIISPEVSSQLAEHAIDDTLTRDEISVLRLIAGGCANKEIGARMSLSEEAVKSRVRNILAKLDAKDRTHAVTIGVKRGIIEL